VSKLNSTGQALATGNYWSKLIPMPTSEVIKLSQSFPSVTVFPAASSPPGGYVDSVVNCGEPYSKAMIDFSFIADTVNTESEKLYVQIQASDDNFATDMLPLYISYAFAPFTTFALPFTFRAYCSTPKQYFRARLNHMSAGSINSHVFQRILTVQNVN
jgi:hypothetical protein